MESIYLDHAATSPIHPEVAEVVYKTMKDHFGNASSIHQFGRDSRKILDQSREVFAKSIGAKPSEIIITSGGSESDNTAIIGAAFSRQEIGKHIITTAVEHEAVLKPMEYLEELGFEVTYLPVDTTGKINLKQFAESLRPDTILVSIMYANNEVGTLMDCAKVGTIIQESGYNTLFHTDAVQAYGSEQIDVKKENIDLLSVSAHKINGPKGIGFLYVKEGVSLPSFIRGGEQEAKRRAGTENIPAIAGFKKAVEISQSTRKERIEKYKQLRITLLKKLNAANIDFSINGSSNQHVDHIINLWFKGVLSEQMVMNLDLAGVALSAGSACTAGNIEPSHVLKAMYGSESSAISESIRISFGLGTTLESVDKAADKIIKTVSRLKK